MDLTMTRSLIALASAIPAGSARYGSSEGRVAIRASLHSSEHGRSLRLLCVRERAFQDSLHNLVMRTSGQGGSRSAIAELHLGQSPVQAHTRVG